MFNDILVWLGDGPNSYSGNVYAKNPVTNVSGPVCDDRWDILGVSYIRLGKVR